MTSFSRCAPELREVSQAEGAGHPRTWIRARTCAGGRAGRGRDGQHLGQLSPRAVPGCGSALGALPLPPQCTAAPAAGGGDPSRLSSSLVPAPARRSAAEGARRFYRFHLSS